MSENPKILFVEDEEPVLKSLIKFFTKQGFDAFGRGVQKRHPVL